MYDLEKVKILVEDRINPKLPDSLKYELETKEEYEIYCIADELYNNWTKILGKEVKSGDALVLYKTKNGKSYGVKYSSYDLFTDGHIKLIESLKKHGSFGELCKENDLNPEEN